MKRPLLRSFLVVAASALLLTSSGRAAVEFSDFGEPGNTYINTAQYVLGSSHGGYQAYAAEFTASFTGMLTTVDVAVVAYDEGNITLDLYQNNPATNLPLTASGITLGNIVAPNSSAVVTLTLGSGVTVPLAAGGSYWLALTPADGSTAAGWDVSNNGGAARVAVSTDGGATYQGSNDATAFDINAVPEPSTWAMLLCGVGLLGLALHRCLRQA